MSLLEKIRLFFIFGEYWQVVCFMGWYLYKLFYLCLPNLQQYDSTNKRFKNNMVKSTSIQFTAQLNPLLFPYLTYYPTYHHFQPFFAFCPIATPIQSFPSIQLSKEERLNNYEKPLIQTSQNLLQMSGKDDGIERQLVIGKGGNSLISQFQRQQKQRQIKSRNILPNKVNLILSYIRRVNRSGSKVDAIINKIAKQGEKYNAKMFYSYQAYIKNNIYHLVNKNALRNVVNFCDPSSSIFSIQDQIFYNKVCRILVKHFIRQECLLNLLASRKMYKTRRFDHLRTYRMILNDLKANNAE